MFITVIANHRGLVDAAAVGLIEKMISFFVYRAEFYGRYRQRAHGAKRRRGQGRPRAQVLKDAMTISVVYGCLITVLMWLVAPALSAFLPRTLQ